MDIIPEAFKHPLSLSSAYHTTLVSIFSVGDSYSLGRIFWKQMVCKVKGVEMRKFCQLEIKNKKIKTGNGAFTLPDTDTDIDTDTDKFQQYSMALLCRCSVNTSTQFFTTHFLSVSVSVLAV